MEEKKYIPGSVASVLSISQSRLYGVLKETQHHFKIGMQRYLAIERTPHCFIVGCASSDKGISLDEICKLEEVNISHSELSSILDELKSFGLVYQDGKRIYATKTGLSILKEAGIPPLQYD